MTRVKPFHLQTPLTISHVPCYKPTFLPLRKKTQNPNIFTFMVSEFRKYRTELKKALKWPPPPQRKKREEKLVMSWSLCDCLTADVTQLYTRTHFSLAGNHCSAARNQPPKPAAHRAPKHRPANTPRSHPGCTRKKFLSPLPPPPSKPQTRAEGRAQRRSATTVPLHRCVATERLCRSLLATAVKLSGIEKSRFPLLKKTITIK